MSELLNAQKEFESLITQLERLKKVNEITSTNTSNANKVITELEGFAVKSDRYIKELNENNKLLEKSLNSVVEDLKKSIAGLNEKSDELGMVLENRLKRIQKEFEDIEELERKSAKNQVTIEKNLKSQIKSLGKELEVISSSVENKLSSQAKEVKVIKNGLFAIAGLIITGLLVITFFL